jgi:hypothetical protein
LKYDREVLCLGCLLHDLGLTDRFDEGCPFEIDGANAARTFLLEHGFPAEKADVVHEAIALHVSLVAEQHPPEIALVRFGAIVDVFGSRVEEIPPEMVHQFVEAYPRLGFKQAFYEALAVQARRKPTSAAAELFRSGRADGILHAPFAE